MQTESVEHHTAKKVKWSPERLANHRATMAEKAKKLSEAKQGLARERQRLQFLTVEELLKELTECSFVFVAVAFHVDRSNETREQYVFHGPPVGVDLGVELFATYLRNRHPLRKVNLYEHMQPNLLWKYSERTRILLLSELSKRDRVIAVSINADGHEIACNCEGVWSRSLMRRLEFRYQRMISEARDGDWWKGGVV